MPRSPDFSDCWRSGATRDAPDLLSTSCHLGAPLPRGLAEKVFVPINGVSQRMIIESKDSSNPVLLYRHFVVG